MMINSPIFKINGVEYYVPVDYYDYIKYDEDLNTLILLHSGSVTLYSSLSRYNQTGSGYPRITLQYGQYPRYITYSGNYQQTQDLSISSFEVIKGNSILSSSFTSIILLIVLGVAVLWRSLKN